MQVKWIASPEKEVQLLIHTGPAPFNSHGSSTEVAKRETVVKMSIKKHVRRVSKNAGA